MKLSTHDVSKLIDNTQDLLTPQMREKNIRCVTEIPKDTPPILMDMSQLERVFINLVGNAVKFTPDNGTITIKVENDKEKLTVHITDTGIGINKEDMPKLFNEFYRVDNEINQYVKGTGLGLALAKNIVEAHQGKIWVDSKPKEGTTFHFSIPFERREEPPEEEQNPEE